LEEQSRLVLWLHANFLDTTGDWDDVAEMEVYYDDWSMLQGAVQDKSAYMLNLEASRCINR